MLKSHLLNRTVISRALAPLPLCLAVVSGVPSVGMAAEPPSEQRVARLSNEANLTLVEAVTRALQKVDGGRPVRVELREQDKRIVWEVSVLNEQNKVEEVLVDGRNGEILLPVASSHGYSRPSR